MSVVQRSQHAQEQYLHPFLVRNLVSPRLHQSLCLESDTLYPSTTTQRAEVYTVTSAAKKIIPIMIDTTGENTHYHQHYQTDAEQFDYFAPRNDPATDHDERRLREQILRSLRQTLQHTSNPAVLDVGCGNAWLAGSVLPLGAIVCSMDISTVNPCKAIEKYPHANHCAIVADAYALPFGDATFECIVASEIIEHVDNPRAFVRELTRCLKPGGRLIITTPYKERLRYVLCVHCNKKTPLHAHIHSFDESILASLQDATFNGTFSWKVFGNKALIFGRAHILLQYFPNTLWSVIDKIASLLINKQAHILVQWSRL